MHLLLKGRYEKVMKLETIHFIWTRNVSEKQLIKEIELTQEAIFNINGYQPSLFRPVQGFYNQKLVDVVERPNLQVVLWSQKHVFNVAKSHLFHTSGFLYC